MSAVAPLRTKYAIGRNLAEIENFQIENFRLRFYTLLPEPASGEGKKNNLLDLERSANRFLNSGPISKLLGNLDSRQLALLKDLAGASASGIAACYSFEMELCENFVTGMAQHNSWESGMALLRPWGFPFIPDSTVKGVLRNTLGEILCGANVPSKEIDDKLDAAGLLPLFGDGGETGHILFFDALPGKVQLEGDMMNPHYRDYYGDGKTAPAGYNNPVPIYFLTVKSKSVFSFSFAVKGVAQSLFPLNDLTPEDRAQLKEFEVDVSGPEAFVSSLLEAAGKYHGFGSQTRKGLGRMKLIKKDSFTE